MIPVNQNVKYSFDGSNHILKRFELYLKPLLYSPN